MRYQQVAALAVMAGLLALAGCGEEPAPTQPVTKPAAKPPAVAVAPPQAAAAEAPPVEVKFVYVLEGRRDPFVPLIATKATVADFENPLEAFDLPQFVIKGLIIGMGETKAMVLAPDGRAYILRTGMRLGKANGVVREISKQRILVEEQYQDITGKTRKNMQELKVPVREGV